MGQPALVAASTPPVTGYDVGPCLFTSLLTTPIIRSLTLLLLIPTILTMENRPGMPLCILSSTAKHVHVPTHDSALVGR